MSRRSLLGIVLSIVLALGLASCELFQLPGGEPGVDMEAAVEAVKETVLPEVIPPDTTYRCLRMDEALPAGSVIEEDAPEGDADTQGQTAPKGLTIGEESFFFFLDLAPGTYYEHPVKYIVLPKSGGYQVMDATWWPKIDGETPDQFVDPSPEAKWIVEGNVTLEQTTGMEMLFDLSVVLRQIPREGFIIVQGLMSHESLYDDATLTYLNGVNFFNAYKSAYSVLDGLVMSQAANVLDRIDDMVADKLNPITIYIIAHGGVDGIRLGGQWFTAQQFRNKMNEHSTTSFNFLLGSCHSGSFLDDLNTLSNVKVIQAACASDEGAAPDRDNIGGTIDHNTEDTGSEWTSSILRAAELIVNDSTRWTQIQSWSSSYGVPITSVLLDAAFFGSLGSHTSFGMTDNLDLTNRTGHTQPQRYRSWLIFIPLLPIIGS